MIGLQFTDEEIEQMTGDLGAELAEEAVGAHLRDLVLVFLGGGDAVDHVGLVAIEG